jgi:cytochrome b5
LPRVSCGDLIFPLTGKDATEAFEDLGHSDDARSLLLGLYVGELEGGDVSPVI